MSSNETRVIGEYFRGQNGATVHLAPCPSMGKAVRWTYADRMSLHEVAAEVAAVSWMRLCRRCWPAGAIAAAGGPVSVGEGTQHG